MRPFISILVTALLSAAVSQQAPNTPSGKNAENAVSANRCFAKGGIGIVNTHLYIDLESPNNELRLDGGKRWVGQNRETREVVLFFENKVWSTTAAPPGFDLGKAQIVSFEGDVVRFLDFTNTSGGYYERSK